MAKPGPKKKPKAILQLSGSWRGKARGKEPEAEPPDKLRCPAWLEPIAKTTWRNVVQQMKTMGILSMADADMVARYSDTMARWRAARKFIREKGEGYPVYKDGHIVAVRKYPHTVAASQLLSDLDRMANLLGLSPSARASLAVENKGQIEHEPDEKARFFRAG